MGDAPARQQLLLSRDHPLSTTGIAIPQGKGMNQMQWTKYEMFQSFFIYIEQMGAEDLLWPLNSNGRANMGVAEDVFAVFERNLSEVAHAATVPFFVAMLAANTEKTRIVGELIEHARRGEREKLSSAMSILDSGARSIADTPFETFKMLHEKKVLSEAFFSLYSQASILVWGAFENLVFECAAVLFTRKPQLLMSLKSRGEQIWGRDPEKVKRKVESLIAADAGLASVTAFKGLAFRTVQMDRLRPIIFLLDPTGVLGAQIDTPILRTLEARRHLFVHRGGICDKKYLDDTNDGSTIGARLTVTPKQLENYFRAVALAGLRFAEAVDASAR